jgi:hypothetical protein
MNRGEVRSIAVVVAIQRGGHIKALTTVIFDRLRECRR